MAKSVQRVIFSMEEPFTQNDVMEHIQQTEPHLASDSETCVILDKVLKNWVRDGTLWQSDAEFTFKLKPVFREDN